MPNKDKTGPQGKGPKTGRQLGNCEDAKPECPRRMGQKCGRGFRNQNKE